MTISLAAIAAQRANAAYIENAADSKAAFSSLGDLWIAMYQKPGIQAVLSTRKGGDTYLSISGTRSALSLDVFEDVSLERVEVEGGSVTKGVYEGMADLWRWAAETSPSGARFSVCGHSLGASRTHLTPLFVASEHIGAMFSFEAPKFCDAAYYAAHKTDLKRMLCFLNGHDLWASWPWDNPEWAARPLNYHFWLTGDEGQYSMIKGIDWPGGLSAADHSMDAVAKRIAAMDKILFKSGN